MKLIFYMTLICKETFPSIIPPMIGMHTSGPHRLSLCSLVLFIDLSFYNLMDQCVHNFVWRILSFGLGFYHYGRAGIENSASSLCRIPRSENFISFHTHPHVVL